MPLAKHVPVDCSEQHGHDAPNDFEGPRVAFCRSVTSHGNGIVAASAPEPADCRNHGRKSILAFSLVLVGLRCSDDDEPPRARPL